MDMKTAADEIGISVEAYVRLCSIFLSTTREDLAALSAAVDAQQRRQIESLAHHIKGAASNMELHGLQAQAQLLQEAAAEAPVSELRQLHDRISELFEEIETSFGERDA